MKRNYFRRFLGLHRAILFVLFAQLFTLTTTAEEVIVDGIKYDAVKKAKQATVIANSYSGDVVIPSSFIYDDVEYSVTAIGASAFYGCRNLTSITIPESVTSIGGDAFYNCTGLTAVHITDIAAWCNISFGGYTSHPLNYSSNKVKHLFLNGQEVNDLVIPNSVTSIGSYAFSGCSGLTSVTIPNSVTSIGSKAFSGCSGLTSVTIGNSVTSIGDAAFYGCSGLTSVTIPNSVTSIEYSAFYGCSGLTSMTIPNSVTSIGSYAFSDCSGLTSVTIPNSVTSIGSSAFRNCSGLTSVTIPNSVTSIGSKAFSGCSGLTSVTIPNSVTSIGDHAFYGCSGLTSVTIPNSVTSIGDYAFYGCSGLTSVTIPSSVTSIGYEAFRACSGLTSVTIGNSVTSIGGKAFANCEELMDVYCLASKVPTAVNTAFDSSYPEYITLHVMSSAIKDYKATAPWSSFGSIIAISGEDPSPKIQFADAAVKAICVDNWDVNGDGKLSEDEAAQVTSIGQIFRYNSEITSFNELQYFTGLTSIGEEAFYNCSSLTSVTIPNSVTSIGRYAFSDCSGLTSVTIGNGVTSIGYGAFYGCSGLTSVTIPNGVTSIGSYAFSSCSGLTSVTIGNSVTSIGSDAFNYCSGLTKAEFASIESLCKIKFGNYYSNPLSYAKHLYINGQEVTDVVIPNSVTSIGEYAFSGCSGLTSITIPNSVTSIGYRAFYNCTGLTSVTIPNSVTSIGGNAFFGCSGLTSVTIPNSVTSIGQYAFYNCSSLTSVTIPNSVTSIGDYAFEYCRGLTSVTIPNSVTSIGRYAFSDCSGLTSVTIGNGVTSIGEHAFAYCNKLKVVSCLAENVPSTGGSCFYGVPQSTATLYVPASSVNAYKSAEDWSDFGTILPIGDDTSSKIQFADAVVKTICVAKWDINGDGELSEKEAARVKDIGTVFQSNKEITSFDELQYFTGLTSIGTQAFYSCSSLTSVTIPESVTRIGESAFSGCSGLTKAEFASIESFCKITFGNSLSNPVYYAKHLYINGQEVIDVVIPNSVTSIGYYAFFGCSGLTSVTIPNSVTSIGEYAFYKCSGLTSVTIGNSVTSIGESAFYYCSGLTSVTCHAMNVPSTGNNCFSYVPQSTATLYVPASSVNAYKSAEQWKNFRTILPIGSEVPTNYNITATANPANGGSIRGAGTYQDRASVTLTASPAEGYEFENWTENGTTVSTQASYTFIITEDRTLVANFKEAVNPNIQFADAAVKAICVANWDTDGDGELSKDEAAQVTNIGTIFKSNETITSFDELQYFTGLTSIGYSAFEGCSNLTSVTFGNGLKSIGSWAFYLCSSLTSVTIPNNVTSINEGAFSYCTSLKSATIGDGVTGIGHSAFSYCTDLVSVTIGNSVRSIGNSAFVGCSSLPSIDIPNSVTSIAAGTFWGCTSLKSVTVPSSVESIGSDAFSGCYGLASVTLNSNNIVSAAYSSSNNLKTIFGSQVTRYILGNDVTSIGANAFRGSSDLISVTVPNSVTSIGEGAFAECDGLTSVTLNSNNIVSSTYTSSSNLNTVFGSQVIEYIIGDEVTSIGNYAFYSSTGLTSLTIGNGVTSIGDRAFYGCTGLKNVVCRAQRVPTASSNCFGGITLSSATLYVPASSVNSYKSTSPWSDFGTVTSIPENFQIWGIKVNKSEILLHAQGNPYQLIATVVPEYAANKALTWTSSNTSVATVDANGLITPVNQGTAVITATTKDGTNLSATCTVTVDADNIIKDVSQLSNDKCYYIYTKDQLRGGLGVNKKYGSLASTFSVTNVKYKTENMSPFVFFKYHDKFLLYSVEANAFVTYNGGLTRMNIIGSNAINVTKNTNEYFMFSFASTGGVVNINTNPGLAINNWGTTSSQFDEGNQFIIEIAGDFDPSVMVALINESETVSDEDEEHYAQTPIQSVSELVNGQVYTAVTNRAAWYVPESGTQLESTKLPIWDKWSCKNTGQQFAFILHDGKYYIYNVGEQKILNGITDNSPNHGELVTDNCQPVTISGTGNLQYPLFFSYGASYNVNINSWGEVVIDTWTTLDDGNMVALRPVQGVTLSESDLRRIIRYIDGSIPGDVNGDGDVNGADIVAVINYVLNDSKTEGDVNGDGEVNGADIVAVINYVLSYTSDAVRQQTYYAHRAPARPTDTSDRLYANTVTDGITVGLTNETDFTAFQFILQLPEDCTLENVIADGLRLDNHVLQFRRMADGRYFVLGYNLDNENIAGHDGALLRLQLAGNICEGASVTDVMFFTPDAKTHRLAGLHIDLVTGLTSLENATEDATGNIYDMQGRVVMTSGQYAKQKNFLPTGIYIRNGRKFVVK